MDEKKFDVKDKSEFEKKITQKNIQLKEGDLKKIDKALSTNERFVALKTKLNEIEKEANNIAIANYKRISDVDFEYENDLRYQELILQRKKILAEKEEIDNEQQLLKLKDTSEQLIKMKEDTISKIAEMKKEIEGE